MKWLLICMTGLMAGCTSYAVQYSPSNHGLTERNTVESINVFFIKNVERTVVDISPQWDLGRVGLKPGNQELLHLTLTVAYSDIDNNLRAIQDTHRDRRKYHLWIVIPSGTMIDEVIDVAALDDGNPSYYEQDEFDEIGRKILPSYVAAVAGTLRKRMEHSEFAVFEMDLRLTPNTQAVGNEWAVEGHIVGMKEFATKYPPVVTEPSTNSD